MSIRDEMYIDELNDIIGDTEIELMRYMRRARRLLE